ncbi:hypothetical protein VaNZ11_004624 [Volvox africanus]|uniref:Uncharacterized protein n=1 Tax=Volvox africanus TaxID=51714 RepID=A0ABQ5RWN4_9CHLO|nr:hypothetical protein VaNZ11_004624 [Volvox africanus]
MRTFKVIITSGTLDGSVCVCDLRAGEITKSWKGNFSQKGVCVLGSDFFAAAQADKPNVQFFCLQDHAQTRALVAETVSVLTATADGHYLAGGCNNGTIYLWELCSGRLLRAWPAHFKGVTALLFGSGASLLLSGGEDTMLHAWLLADLLDPALDGDRGPPMVANPKPLHSWCDHTLQVTAMAAGVGNAAAVLASASLDRTVKLRRLGDGCQLRSQALPAAINDILLSTGEETLYAAGADGIVYAVALATDAGSQNAITDAVMTGSDARGFLDAQDGGSYHIFVGHSRPVTCLALASLDSGLGCSSEEAHFRHGEVLVSGSEDGTVRVWDLYSRQAVRVITITGKAPIKSIQVLPCLMIRSPQLRTSSHITLSKFEGLSVHGSRWQGPAICVDGSERLPRGGLLRLEMPKT